MAGFDHLYGQDDYDPVEYIEGSFTSEARERALPGYLRNTYTSSINQAAGEAKRDMVTKKHTEEAEEYSEHSHSLSHVTGSPQHAGSPYGMGGGNSYELDHSASGSKELTKARGSPPNGATR